MLTVSITSSSALQIVIGSSSTDTVMEDQTGMSLLLCAANGGPGELPVTMTVSFTVTGNAGRLFEMLSL